MAMKTRLIFHFSAMSSISLGEVTMWLGEQASSSALERNPHNTATESNPAFRAVFMSMDVSPTYSAWLLSWMPQSLSMSKTMAGSGFTL